MDAFPAFFPLSGRTIIVAGHGEGADNKARLFDGSPATLVRIDGPEAFLPGSYAGAIIAFIAGDDLFVQGAAAAARNARALVNVVDRPDLSDFFTPALIDRGEVVAAVGTAGAAPMLASLLRNDIEARIPQGAGRLAALLRRRQDDVRAAFPDQALRRGFLREIMNGPVAEAALAGASEKADRLLLDALAAHSRPTGRVRIVSGKGSPDLVSLRASRALSEADVLVVPDDVEPGILALGRRDAARLTPAQAEAEALIALARAGRQVVRLLSGPVDAREVRALTAAGVTVEVLQSAPGA